MVTVLFSACAANQIGGTQSATPPLADTAFGLTVTNNHSQRVEIYVLPEDTGAPVRMGVVQANFSRTFRVPLAKRPIRLGIRPVGSNHEQFATRPIAVQEGAAVRLLVRSERGIYTLRIF